jgi:rare lipoprotein A
MLAVLLASTMGAAPGTGTSDSKAKATSAVKQQSPTKPAKPYQVGKASWYGESFHGKETASGERFDMFKFTAAHRALPLGSWVRVTNLSNNRSVIVRINDRGPVIENRIIDLSREAAKQLGLKGQGVAKVRLDVVAPAHPQETVAVLERGPLAGVE